MKRLEVILQAMREKDCVVVRGRYPRGYQLAVATLKVRYGTNDYDRS